MPDPNEMETLFGGLFEAQAADLDGNVEKNERKSSRNEEKLAVAESVSFNNLK